MEAVAGKGHSSARALDLGRPAGPEIRSMSWQP